MEKIASILLVWFVFLIKRQIIECQSAGFNTSSLAAIASTFANVGVNPTTNSRIFDTKSVKQLLSVMFSCGMGQYSGQWEFYIGTPAVAALNGSILAGIFFL